MTMITQDVREDFNQGELAKKRDKVRKERATTHMPATWFKMNCNALRQTHRIEDDSMATPRLG